MIQHHVVQIGDRVACLPSDEIGDRVPPEKGMQDFTYEGRNIIIFVWPYTGSFIIGKGAWVIFKLLLNRNKKIYGHMSETEPLALLGTRTNDWPRQIVPCSKIVLLPSKTMLDVNKDGELTPKISKYLYRKLQKKIRPVLRLDPDGYIDVTRKTITYVAGGQNGGILWNPKPLKKAKGLVEIGDIYTYHPFATKEFFYVYARDVIAQLYHRLPPELLERVAAYEVDCDNNEPGFLQTCHKIITTLYTKKP